jgi:hypothetical protein
VKNTIKKCMIGLTFTVLMLLYFLHTPLVCATTPAYYENVWTWSGKTQSSYDTQVSYKDYETCPPDPFDKNTVVNTATTEILTDLGMQLKENLTQMGIACTIEHIDPTVTVETTQTSVSTPGPYWTVYTVTFHHYLHMGADVYFRTDKPISKQQYGTFVIDPATVALLIYVIQAVVIPLAVALAIILIAQAISTWIRSFGTTTNTVTTTSYDANGNPITTTKTTQGGGLTDISTWIGMAIVAVVVIVGYSIIFKRKK